MVQMQGTTSPLSNSQFRAIKEIYQVIEAGFLSHLRSTFYWELNTYFTLRRSNAQSEKRKPLKALFVFSQGQKVITYHFYSKWFSK